VFAIFVVVSWASYSGGIIVFLASRREIVLLVPYHIDGFVYCELLV
jgi:hypothetical protein